MRLWDRTFRKHVRVETNKTSNKLQDTGIVPVTSATIIKTIVDILSKVQVLEYLVGRVNAIEISWIWFKVRESCQ